MLQLTDIVLIRHLRAELTHLYPEAEASVENDADGFYVSLRGLAPERQLPDALYGVPLKRRDERQS
jgi:hypothetical protein